MSIHTRGNSHRVIVKHKRVVVFNKSYPDLAEAKRVEKNEKAKLTLFGTGTTWDELRSSDLATHAIAQDEADPALIIQYFHRERSQQTAPKPPIAPAHGPTLKSLVLKFLKDISPKRAGHAIEKCRLNQFARHPVAERAVSSLTTDDFIAYQSERLELGKSHDTINIEMSLWKKIFAVARELKWCRWPRDDDGNSVNPAAIKFLSPGEPRNIRLTKAQEACLMKHARATPWPMLPIAIRLLLEINMRRGELLRMKRSDIDFEGRQVTLDASTVKNRRTREVPLTSRAIAILREALEVIPDDGSDRVFPCADRTFSYRFLFAKTQAAKEMPAIAKFRLHDTRHESISRMSIKIKSTVVLARATGHREPRHLMRYVNVTSAELADMLE